MLWYGTGQRRGPRRSPGREPQLSRCGQAPATAGQRSCCTAGWRATPLGLLHGLVHGRQVVIRAIPAGALRIQRARASRRFTARARQAARGPERNAVKARHSSTSSSLTLAMVTSAPRGRTAAALLLDGAAPRQIRSARTAHRLCRPESTRLTAVDRTRIAAAARRNKTSDATAWPGHHLPPRMRGRDCWRYLRRRRRAPPPYFQNLSQAARPARRQPTGRVLAHDMTRPPQQHAARPEQGQGPAWRTDREAARRDGNNGSECG